MARERKGTTIERDGKIYARVTYIGEDGKRHAIWRRAENRTDAREIKKELLNKLETYGERAIEGDRMTFQELAQEYKKRKLVPAEYIGERKIGGLRSLKAAEVFLKTLAEYFGKRLIRNITHSSVEKFQRARLKVPTVRGSERTIASVNRELEMLRSVLNFAKRESWLIRSPFELGAPLISKADETRRERVLSRVEEERLLSACTGRRAHLRPIIIAALDTACRRGELFQLKWSDVNFETRTISVRALTTKTARARSVPISSRLLDELTFLHRFANSDKDLVFGVNTDVKHAFASVCKVAGIKDFHFHDCRHSGITRMIQAGLPPAIVMKISGHTQMTTFSRYVNVDADAISRAAAALDAFNQSASEDDIENAKVN